MAEGRNFDLEIITPDRVFYQGQASMIEFNTTEGEMGVLYDHEPVVTLLGYKDVVYTQGGQKKKATALGGFAEITKDRVTILTDASELADEIDLERAKKAKEREEAKKKAEEEEARIAAEKKAREEAV